MAEFVPSRKDVGWVFVQGAHRAHYFRDRKSLCGVWAYWGRCFIPERYELAGKCKACESAAVGLVKKKVFDPATDAWLEEHDWKRRAGGDDDGA